MNRFINKLVLRQLFYEIDLELHHNIKFSTSQILCSILLGILSGIDRVSKIETFSRDPLIQNLIGLTCKLDGDTILNRIKRFGVNENNKIMNIIGQLSVKVHNILDTYSDIIDMDSTVRTLFDNQEGAATKVIIQPKKERKVTTLL